MVMVVTMVGKGIIWSVWMTVTSVFMARPKMVTNSFGNRNLMQPMGRLSMHSL
jgi:hypothetical protein